MEEVVPRPNSEQPPRWRALSATDRRVVGVLVEKAKTTPDQYPMSINSIRSGCNQKSNRYPLVELELEDIEESLERLRGVGAVTEVQGGSRVARYRHHMYEWLGVDKVELGVMTELLLRGAQTEGELRGRAARLDPIADVAALRPILVSLKAKGLIVSLTPEGRGHMLTHALYEERELEKVRREASAGAGDGSHDDAAAAPVQSRPAEVRATDTYRPSAQPAVAPRPAAPTAPAAVVPAPRDQATQAAIDTLRGEVDDLRSQLANLRKDLDELWSNFR